MIWVHYDKPSVVIYTPFQQNDPSLESQWRALILFGKNTTTYKFAFAKSLLQAANQERNRVSLKELALPFARYMVAHIRANDNQGNVPSSRYLNACRAFIRQEIDEEALRQATLRDGFRYVIDAFQQVNGAKIPQPFYQKDFAGGSKGLVITDELLRLKESFHFPHFGQEVEARWQLVETAWNLKINPNLLDVKYDEDKETLYLEKGSMRRVDVTSARDALNGYQKGKCFYSFQDISILSGSENLCAVDHFLPHINKQAHDREGANINGVWNLVLAEASVNRNKLARVPEIRFLQRLHRRNEWYISSKHPLAETIINQTGKTTVQRAAFLNRQYDIALQASIHTWAPTLEFPGSF